MYGKSYAYDGNQVVTVTHSNGLVENYSYDAMGNIVNESDSNGRTTTYVYDNTQSDHQENRFLWKQ